jgi:2-phosphosulfolactate phosphatase
MRIVDRHGTYHHTVMTNPNDPFDQSPYRLRLEWGRRGTRRAAERGDILVIVDTLSFSSAVITAVAHGGVVYPCAHDEDPAEVARQIGGEAALGRGDAPTKGRFSLSPRSYLALEPGTRVALASPNGATCSRYARDVPYLFVGALLNSRAVAGVVAELLQGGDRALTVIACGERWVSPSEDEEMRVAIEDYLGAGAILSYLDYAKSPEARVCEAAFTHCRDDLAALVWDCGSGRELRARGFGEDVRHCGCLDLYDAVPVMREGRFEGWGLRDA